MKYTLGFGRNDKMRSKCPDRTGVRADSTGTRLFTGIIRRKIFLLLLIFSLPFPGSYSVLCIADNHIAIEDLNDLCRDASSIPNSSAAPIYSGFGPSDGCNHCTDVFLGSNLHGVLPKPYRPTAVNPLLAECLGPDSPGDVFHPFVAPGKIRGTDIPPPVSSAVPLRC